MSVHSMPVLSDAEIAERVGALIAKMTAAEKAGQLTQYFYFGPPPPGRGGRTASRVRPPWSRRRWRRGRSGRCCSSPTRRR